MDERRHCKKSARVLYGGSVERGLRLCFWRYGRFQACIPPCHSISATPAAADGWAGFGCNPASGRGRTVDRCGRTGRVRPLRLLPNANKKTKRSKHMSTSTITMNSPSSAIFIGYLVLAGIWFTFHLLRRLTILLASHADRLTARFYTMPAGRRLLLRRQSFLSAHPGLSRRLAKAEKVYPFALVAIAVAYTCWTFHRF